jgi:hypothetical protein
MKKALFIIILLLSLPQVSDAHILKTDKNIGVLLHVTPDDDPIIGQPANIFFEVRDKENKFVTTQCDCTIRILNRYQQVFEGPFNSAFSYTFTEKSVYSILVKGIPRVENGFQPFEVRYDLRVSREAGDKKANTFLPLAAAAVALGILGYFLVKYLRKH